MHKICQADTKWRHLTECVSLIWYYIRSLCTFLQWFCAWNQLCQQLSQQTSRVILN